MKKLLLFGLLFLLNINDVSAMNQNNPVQQQAEEDDEVLTIEIDGREVPINELAKFYEKVGKNGKELQELELEKLRQANSTVHQLGLTVAVNFLTGFCQAAGNTAFKWVVSPFDATIKGEAHTAEMNLILNSLETNSKIGDYAKKLKSNLNMQQIEELEKSKDEISQSSLNIIKKYAAALKDTKKK